MAPPNLGKLRTRRMKPGAVCISLIDERPAKIKEDPLEALQVSPPRTLELILQLAV